MNGRCSTCNEIKKGIKELDGLPLCSDCIDKIRNEPSKSDRYLLAPNFLDLIVTECGKKIEGEQDSIRVLLVCAIGRLVLNAEPTSYNLLVNSESGAGKDYVTSKVLELFPRDEVIKRTRISPNVFNYWHNAEKEPEWTWDGKTIYLEDASNNIINSEVMKVMLSGGNHATILVNQIPKDLEVRGKPVVIITSASASPNSEMLRRFPLLNLDESIDQTEAIMRKKAKFAEDGISPKYDESLKGALHRLKPYKVKVPYASQLLYDFPSNHIIVRTHWDRFLDLIKASAVLHQFQRKEEKGYLIAEGQDYDLAKDVLLKTTTNASMIPITKLQQKIVFVFTELDRSRLEKSWYSVSELETHITFCNTKSIYSNLQKLTEFGILEQDKQERENSKKSVMVYRQKELLGNIYLPTWEEISCRFATNDKIDTNDTTATNGKSDGTNVAIVTNVAQNELTNSIKEGESE